MITFENGPAHGVTLFLRRAPFLLRVTCRPTQGNKEEWDALDQLDDRVEDEESIFVYFAKPVRMGMAFYDGTKNGRRHGWSSVCASYTFLEQQPPIAVMRDNEKWAKWCEGAEQFDRGIQAAFEAWKAANAE